MKLPATDQIKKLDQFTIENEPVSGIDLMERASHIFTIAFLKHLSGYNRIIVFAGPGNNGGDALAIARMLLQKKYKVKVLLFNPKGNLSENCEINKDRLLNLSGVEFEEVKNNFTPFFLKEDDVVVDGLFGSGLNKPLEGIFPDVVQFINKSERRVVSIDIPSGLFGEDNILNNTENIIRADFTFTFQFPKLSFFFAENENYTGIVEVLDIGLHPDGISQVDTPYQIIQREDVKNILKIRSRFAHKGNFGHALLIAGSKGKMGAAVLSGKACLRAGTGLLTVHVPSSGNSIIQSCLPEAMTNIDSHESFFSEMPDLTPYNAVAVGPGLSTEEEPEFALSQLLERHKGPVILDADAINILAKRALLKDQIPENSILTPHPKEFDRLVGNSISSYERLQKAIQFAFEKQVYIVLKGRYTAVCTPLKQCWFNTTGNPGMATAGSGDVLTGILLGLLAQKYTPEEASLAGVYLHGLAGDLALSENSEESLLSGDIIHFLGDAFKKIKH